MTRMGKYFKAPPKTAFAQWLKVELLYRFGERFYSSRAGLSRTCRTLRSTLEYLTNQGNPADDVRWELDQLRRLRGTRDR
jgi:hypothetical protein